MKVASTPSAPSIRRRWFQFSLRTLLLFMLVIACGFAWFGKKLNEARQRKAAVEVVQRFSGEALYDFNFDSQGARIRWTFDSQGKMINPAQPSQPARLIDLLGIDFFCQVHTVDKNNWAAYRVSDNDLEQIVSLKALKELSLPGAIDNAISDTGMKQLHNFPQLVSLSLNSQQVTNEGLKALKGLTHLKKLYLRGMQVTDAGLGQLAELPNLEELHLLEMNITGSGLVSLKKAACLRSLFLERLPVSDDGLRTLQELTQLKIIYLETTQVTEEGVFKLRQALPNCLITMKWDNTLGH